MDAEGQRYFELAQRENDELKSKNLLLQNEYNQQSGFNSSKDTAIAELQLNLDKELDKYYHLLSSHYIGNTGKGTDWLPPKDDRLKILSEYGVQRLMNILSFYLNINTLLSNLTEEQINEKMLQFGEDLTDLIYNQYELIFSFPTPEELYDKYSKQLKSEGKEFDDRELYFKCVQWSEEELKLKERNYDMYVTSLTDAVHFTMLRALNGEERESLRKQMHISQSANYNPGLNQPQSFSPLKPSTWGKG